MSEPQCRCGSRLFVFWIPESNQWSGPASISCLQDRLNESPRCFRCNRDLVAGPVRITPLKPREVTLLD